MTFCLGNASHVFLASPLVARASPPSLQLSPANFRMVNIQCTSSKQPNTKPRVARGITKPRPISPAMQALLGVSEIPRTQALKQIWAYIKQHNLQDPENKKIIICDEKLKSIFAGKDRVGFLEISGYRNPHDLYGSESYDLVRTIT